jgi:hypothetical protein
MALLVSTGLQDRRLLIEDAETGSLIHSVYSPSYLRFVAVHGQTIVAIGENAHAIHIYDTSARPIVCDYVEEMPTRVAFNDDGARFAVSFENGLRDANHTSSLL